VAHRSSERVRTLLLVRNAVSHDARVLRAARVAEKALGGRALIVGVATATAPAGRTKVQGVDVMRLPPRKHRAAQATARAAGTPSPSTAAGTPSRLTPAARAKRIISGARFAWQAVRLARRERPELVQANDWNTMWCAVAIRLTCRARVIYDSHELWADRNGRWEWRPWLVASEALFVRVAQETLTASPGYAQALARRYRIAPPTVVRNIPDVRHTKAREPRQPPWVVYVGGLMPGRGLEQTIDALALTEALSVRMIGPGAAGYRTALAERARAAGVMGRVRIEPAVPPASVPALLGEALAGLCLIQPVCRSYELTLPNKLFEYAAAGVPVLVSDLPVIAAVVRDNGLGEVVPPEDPRGIAAGLERLREPGRWGDAARRSRTFAHTNDWRAESARLADVYRRAVRR
jgi:glycosyltransferase involved in cell wall biosynthesis